MASAVTTTVKGKVTQNRRLKFTSSGLSPSSSAGITGSRAMPQMGQFPGASRRICGCMGHVNTPPAESPSMLASRCGFATTTEDPACS